MTKELPIYKPSGILKYEFKRKKLVINCRLKTTVKETHVLIDAYICFSLYYRYAAYHCRIPGRLEVYGI
jgi:hypothetical protein